MPHGSCWCNAPPTWLKGDLKLSDRNFHCDSCGMGIDRDLNAAINTCIRGMTGMGIPEFTPVEIGTLPAGATPVGEAGSP